MELDRKLFNCGDVELYTDCDGFPYRAIIWQGSKNNPIVLDEIEIADLFECFDKINKKIVQKEDK